MALHIRDYALDDNGSYHKHANHSSPVREDILECNSPHGIDVVEIDGNTYALVTSSTEYGMEIIDRNRSHIDAICIPHK